MSWRESGRERKRRERAAARQAAGLGFEVRPDQSPGVFSGSRLDDHAPGEHVWIVAATYRLSEREILRSADPATPVLLDREALAYVTQPGCYRCVRPYSPELAAQPCAGDEPA